MTAGQLLGLGLIVLIVVLVIRSRGAGRQATYERFERSAMPPELATAKLVLSEGLIRTRVPAKLASRTDQVYLTPEGMLVPVETKTRKVHRAYDTDRIQLSVTAVALSYGNRKLPGVRGVARHGYVRVIRPGDSQPCYLRVDLYTPEQVVKLENRYQALMAGKVEPRPARNPGLCRGCGQLQKCRVGQERLKSR